MSSPLERSVQRRPNRREVAAEATRREIVLAARDLFARDGYAQTSIAAIAERAGVSIPTIYASVGPKPAIVKALVGLVDLGVGGAEARSRIPRETDPAAVVAISAHVNRLLDENFGDILRSLRSAALVEPEVAEPIENARKWHRSASEAIAQRLSGLKALRPGVTKQEAADVIDLLTDNDCFSSLVRRFGWSYDRAEEWICSALESLLLEPSESRRG